MKLSDLRKGDKAIIMDITCQGKMKERLMRTGIVYGAEICLLRRVPGGDIQLKVNDFYLALRKDIADTIKVSLL